MTNQTFSPKSPSESRLGDLLERELTAQAILAEREIPIAHLLDYSLGSIIVLGKRRSIVVRVEVAGESIGRGRVVDLNGQLGVCLDEVRPPREYLPSIL